MYKHIMRLQNSYRKISKIVIKPASSMILNAMFINYTYFKWISGNTRKYRIQNKEIHLQIELAPIDKKMMMSHLRQFGHMHRRQINAPMRKSELIQVEVTKKR